MNRREEVNLNRAAFLKSLREGGWQKGTIKSDSSGRPIFETESDKHGSCVCAIMTQMFGEVDGRLSVPTAAKALGITSATCGFIQREINDTPLNFPEMADRVEAEVFGVRGR